MINPNVNNSEISKFSEENAHWWNKEGPLKTLHDINPLRMNFIKQKVSLPDKSVIDVGCGGGILTQSLAEEGAVVVGIDMNATALATARANTSDLISYQEKTAEEMALSHLESFDVVTCFELLEHVPDPVSVIRACAQLVKPGGHCFFSTLNRNLKSYLFAIIGAEYVLKLLPKKTHDYASFIRPAELAQWSRAQGFNVLDMKGISYNPLTKIYRLSADISVDYLMYLQK